MSQATQAIQATLNSRATHNWVRTTLAAALSVDAHHAKNGTGLIARLLGDLCDAAMKGGYDSAKAKIERELTTYRPWVAQSLRAAFDRDCVDAAADAMMVASLIAAL